LLNHHNKKKVLRILYDPILFYSYAIPTKIFLSTKTIAAMNFYNNANNNDDHNDDDDDDDGHCNKFTMNCMKLLFCFARKG